MKELLSLYFYRLKRSVLFWICTALMFVASIAYMIFAWHRASISPYSSYDLFRSYFYFSLAAGVLCAIFTCLFLGVEHKDGTMRNKLVAGHSSTGIYMAGFLMSYITTLFFLCAWLIPCILLSGLVRTLFALTFAEAMVYLIVALVSMAAYAAIFTFLAMLCRRRVVSLVISLVLMGIMILLSILAVENMRICENFLLTWGSSGTDLLYDQTYIDMIARKVSSEATIWKVICGIFPMGQNYCILACGAARPVMSILSAVAAAILTVIGLPIFRKKDLK